MVFCTKWAFLDVCAFVNGPSVVSWVTLGSRWISWFIVSRVYWVRMGEALGICGSCVKQIRWRRVVVRFCWMWSSGAVDAIVLKVLLIPCTISGVDNYHLELWGICRDWWLGSLEHGRLLTIHSVSCGDAHFYLFYEMHRNCTVLSISMMRSLEMHKLCSARWRLSS